MEILFSNRKQSHKVFVERGFLWKKNILTQN